MQITPKSTPSLASENNAHTAQSERDSSAKARALAILSGGQQNAQATPVADPSNVSVEDLSAVKTSEESPQKYTSEEPAVPPASSEKPKAAEEPVSPQLAMLARKEKALRLQAQQIKTERDSIKAKEAEMEKAYQTKLAEAERSWKSKLQENPLDEEYGLSYDALTEKLLNAPKPEDVARDQYTKKLEARLADLESRQEKQAKTYEEQQASQYKQALNQIRVDATSLITSDPEFETIKETGSIDDVVDLIEKTFKADGVLLTVEEAAKAVEDHLVEEYLKLSKIAKLQKRLQPAAPAKQDQGKQLPESPKQSQTKTLTNNMGSNRTLTPRERAMLAFKGELKS